MYGLGVKQELSESQLCSLARIQLEAMGYKTKCEVQLGIYCIDMVAVMGNNVVAIQMKRGFQRSAITQVGLIMAACDFGVICTQATPNRKSVKICAENGIGLWCVSERNGWNIVRVVEAVRNPYVKNVERDWLLKSFEIASAEPAGGTESDRSHNTSRSTLDRVRGYIEAHPSAGWGEIFDSVPNMYESAQKLSSAMRQCSIIHGPRLPTVLRPEREQTARKTPAIRIRKKQKGPSKIEVWDKVCLRWKMFPRTGWNELHKSIPNPYPSAYVMRREMMSCMGKHRNIKPDAVHGFSG